jgi:hypothetical protein
MRLTNIQNNYLYEDLNRIESNTMMLWESAGFKLKEAALTADQIQQIFQNVEQGATAAGGNRTLIGKGKDAAEAVNKAWEDLKTKVQDSGPVKNVDSAYDSAVAKIEKGLGGPDNAVNQVIQKYRKFAKEHPIAQGIIYSALIAAAGISGAGLGGAAVLGLLKMTDKLLQGEKFSSAAYSGAKTGAMAYGASKIGDMIKGKPEATPTASGDSDYVKQMRAQGIDPNDPDGSLRLGMRGPNNAPDAAPSSFKTDFEKLDKASLGQSMKMNPMLAQRAGMPGIPDDNAVASVASKAADVATSQPYGAGMDPEYLQRVVDAGGKSGVRFKINPEDAAKALDWQAQNGGQAVGAAANAAGNAASGYSADYLQKVISGEHPRPMISKEKAAALLKSMQGESIARTTRPLSEGQVYLVFNRVCRLNDTALAEGQLTEGPLDAIKGAAGKAASWLQTKGKNLTTKVTADKLNSAWQKAGAPTDSEELKAFLTQQGVDQGIVDTVYGDLKIPAAPGLQEPTMDKAAPVDIESIKKMISALPTDRKIRLLKYLNKQIGVA